MKRLLLGLSILAPIFGQEHIAVPLADASRPVTLSIHLLHGSITVRGYSGHEVLVDTTEGTPETESQKTHDGLHRIGGSRGDVSIESDNNKVSISGTSGRHGDLVVQTPVNTSLNVKTLQGGQIVIDGVSGEIEAQNLNGTVSIRNVSGSVVASSLNGGVTATVASVKAGSPMSFTSLNGNIDVTLPATVAADFSMKTNHGEIYSDFDVKLKSPVKPVIEKSVDNKGKFKVHTDGTTVGSVNGGGPEYRFSTLNGNIYIRKK